MDDCLFCQIIERTIPADIVAETDRTLAFRDLAPVASTHVLVIPKRHIENAATVTGEDADDVAALLVAARAVADAEGIGAADRGYRLVFNVGPDAANSVPHLHLHVIGGRAMTWPPG
ncbi:MAG TPA: HIT domain-containing protein [Acidimicrobiales bacterium]|nr:HIT domain-containing protein [Acidimicrobiales bacterium]